MSEKTAVSPTLHEQKADFGPKHGAKNLFQLSGSKENSHIRGHEFYESNETPIIDAGNVASFFIDAPKGDLIKTVNGLLSQGVYAEIGEEGAIIGGYVSKTGLDTIRKLGKVSLGLPGPGRRALFRQRGRTHITSRTTIAGIRGKATGIEGGWITVPKPTEKSIPGPKGTYLEHTPIDEVKLGDFSPEIGAEVFEPIRPDEVTKKHIEKGYAIRIDGNGFGRAADLATEQGQIALFNDYNRFQKSLESKFKGLPVIFGPATGDSGIYYLENLITSDLVVLRAFQEALYEAIDESNVSVKAVGFKIENTNFTLVRGRVAISDKCIPEYMWNRKEDIVKDDFVNYMDAENQAKIQSTVFIRDSSYRDRMLRGSR